MTAVNHKSPGRPKGSGIPPSKCLCCEKQASSRGLCVACYQAAKRRVSTGETTWDFLVANKLARPSRMGQGAKPNAFDTKFAAKSKAK